MTFNPDRAWEELRWLFKGQWQGSPNDGFLAHINFHVASDAYFPGPDEWGTNGAPGTENLGTRTSSISQPPLHSTTVRWMWQRACRPDAAPDVTAQAQVRALLPKLLAHHRWWCRARDSQNTGLVMNIHHPWETGMDNSPSWDGPLARVTEATRAYTRPDLGHVDASMRPLKAFYARMVYLIDFNHAQNFDPAKIMANCPYRVNDIGIISILQRAFIDLAAMCDEFGLSADAAEVRTQVDRTQTSMQALWSPTWRQYLGRDTITDELLEVPTSAGLLASITGRPVWRRSPFNPTSS